MNKNEFETEFKDSAVSTLSEVLGPVANLVLSYWNMPQPGMVQKTCIHCSPCCSVKPASGGAHDKRLRGYEIMQERIKIMAPFEGFEGITTGMTRKGSSSIDDLIRKNRRNVARKQWEGEKNDRN